ncbi:DUF2158 domain-containing protein [Escherichia coli]|nr:DUF2158 domain-containing protein [Escherichia coli]
MRFNIGDVVYLKSESKAMTIIDVDYYHSSAVCSWLDRSDQYYQVRFHFLSLEKRTN